MNMNIGAKVNGEEIVIDIGVCRSIVSVEDAQKLCGELCAVITLANINKATRLRNAIDQSRTRKICAHCGAMWQTGHGTGRRNTGKWCSDRCRVYARRERIKITCEPETS